jgi:hypothetical protein
VGDVTLTGTRTGSLTSIDRYGRVMDTSTTMLVDRSQIDRVELRTESLRTLASGWVRLQIDHVAITANTITYGQFGDLLGYWDFFPAETGWGRVPAIGWGTVVASAVPGVEVGTQLSGWYPMATSVDLQATATESGLRDDGEHRLAHAPTYRAFTVDPDAVAAGADVMARYSLLRGLSGTGQLIVSFLADARFSGLEQVVVLSASAKTSIATAFAARARRNATGGGPAVVGLTSARNEAFVRDLGLYDQVLTYPQAASVARCRSAIVDVAGAGEVVAALHDRLGDRVLHSMVVGKSHHDAPAAAITSGPQPEMFFSPSEVERRVAEVGAAAFRAESAAGVAGFVADSERWLTVERVAGPEAFADAWARAFTGDVPPSVGVVASMSS